MAKPELFDEINALIKTIAQSLVLPEAEVARAFDENRAAVDFGVDPAGRKIIAVTIDGRTARIGLGRPAAP